MVIVSKTLKFVTETKMVATVSNAQMRMKLSVPIFGHVHLGTPKFQVFFSKMLKLLCKRKKSR